MQQSTSVSAWLSATGVVSRSFSVLCLCCTYSSQSAWRWEGHATSLMVNKVRLHGRDCLVNPPLLGHLEDALCPAPSQERSVLSVHARLSLQASGTWTSCLGLLGQEQGLIQAFQLTWQMYVHGFNLLAGSSMHFLHAIGMAQGISLVVKPCWYWGEASLGNSSSLKGFSNSETAQAAQRAARAPVCTSKQWSCGTSMESGVQADRRSAWQISRERTAEAVISKHGKESIPAYTRVCA